MGPTKEDLLGDGLYYCLKVVEVMVVSVISNISMVVEVVGSGAKSFPLVEL